jgi:hypothetical protein
LSGLNPAAAPLIQSHFLGNTLEVVNCELSGYISDNVLLASNRGGWVYCIYNIHTLSENIKTIFLQDLETDRKAPFDEFF